jgi:uncharacterized protein with PQ loop repeat
MFSFLKIFEYISPFAVLLLNIGLLHEIFLITKNKSSKNISVLYFCLLMFVDCSWSLYGIYLDNWFMTFCQSFALSMSILIVLLSLYYNKDS